MNNEQAKEKIKEYWAEGNIPAILQIGFDSFLDMIFEHPLSFDTFLKRTGNAFDRFIIETCAQEPLNFVAGKLHMEMVSETEIRLGADFYFKDQAQQWVLKQKTGGITSSQFKDWETSVDLKILRERRKLELPIDPPKGLR